jgi:hypothetical protein
LKFLFTYLALALAFLAVGQDTIVKTSPLQGFSISGEYRFYAQHRMFTNPYAFQVLDGEPDYLTDRAILLGDASQLPELTLNISGRPTAKTLFGTDLVVWSEKNGQFDYYHNVQLGVNLYADFETEIANVSIKAGGIHWHSMTGLTMKSFSGYNRYSVFDRNPWDPQFKEIDRRYKDYYNNGAISQDRRWAQQAVQGVIVDLTELPLGLSANFIYGKTQNAGAAFTDVNAANDSTSNSFIKFFDNTVPNNVYAGRLIKTFKQHTISLNTFNRKSYSDALAKDAIENHIYTAAFDLRFKKFSIDAELGAARYSDVNQNPGYGEMATVKVRLDKSLLKFPLELHVFHISPNAVNNNAEFVNTSVAEAPSAAAGATAVIGSNGVLQQNGSAMLGMGQMANNRQGLSLNADVNIEKLTITIGNGFAREIENLNSQITYGHTINGLTMSRFWRWTFPSNVGPYGRTSVLFRGVFETVELTDLTDNGDVINKKHFNNMDLQLKYNFSLFSRPFYAFYLGSYNSVQPKFSPITVFTEDAYIRQYTHQLEGYYTLHPKLVLALYGGYERVIASYATLVDITSKKPRNQEGIALGLGVDFQMAKSTNLYIRHRYFQFEDKSFVLDQFAGHETTFEIKINF